MKLNGVEETMLIPLVIRAAETGRKRPRVRDQRAVKILAEIGEDLSRFDRFMSHEGVIARTLLFDQALRHYLEKWPDAAVVNLGCGLDARFERLDNGRLFWYNLDLPEGIDARKRFFPPHERVKDLALSILEADWTEQVAPRAHMIFIIEGVLMYFTQKQVQSLLCLIQERFPGAVILAELMPAFCAAGGGKNHDTVGQTGARFQWGVKSAKDLESLCPGLKVVSDKSFNVVMKRFTFRGWLFGTLPGLRNCNDRLAVLRV